MRRSRVAISDEEADLNMTPMLDVVFIMLIFFVVTASFIKESGVDVNRPGASTAVVKERGNILIGVTANDEIWIDKKRLEIEALRANIVRLHAANPEGAVVIQADKNSRSGLLVQIIDQARLAGVAEVSIAASIERD